MAAILLCNSPDVLHALRTKQDKIILEMKSIYQHVGKGQNLLFIILRSRVPSTHPWIMSTAATCKIKWTLSILLPIVYFGLWKRINLHFSHVFTCTFTSCVFSE